MDEIFVSVVICINHNHADYLSFNTCRNKVYILNGMGKHISAFYVLLQIPPGIFLSKLNVIG